MRLPDEELVEAAMQAYWDHSWRGQRPLIYESQMPELLAVLIPVLDEFARKRSRVPARKPAKVDKGSEQTGRRLVKARSGGLCEVKTRDCAGNAREWQHRKNRSQGGSWHPQNGLHVCRPCHRWIHDHPEVAHANGWTVWRNEDPLEERVVRRGQWVHLDADGGFEPVEKGTAA